MTTRRKKLVSQEEKDGRPGGRDWPARRKKMADKEKDD